MCFDEVSGSSPRAHPSGVQARHPGPAAPRRTAVASRQRARALTDVTMDDHGMISSPARPHRDERRNVPGDATEGMTDTSNAGKVTEISTLLRNGHTVTTAGTSRRDATGIATEGT